MARAPVSAVALVVVAAVLGLTACAPMSSPATRSVTTSTARAVPTAPADPRTFETEASVAASVVPEATTATPAVEACAGIERPAGVGGQPVSLELDGDALSEQVELVNVDNVWHVMVTFGAGGAATAEVRGANGLDAAVVLGQVDLDGDGGNEFALRVGGGAYTEQLAFLRVRDCAVVPLTFDDGTPAVFLVGGSFGGGESLVCSGGGQLERYSYWLLAAAGDETTTIYEGEYASYRIDGDVLTETATLGSRLTGADVASLVLLDCLGLSLS